MDYILKNNNTLYHEKERKIKSILKDEANNKCIDCNINNVEYISLNNACFICKDCFKRHQKFPMNVSNTKINNLRELSLKQLQYLYFGGNKKILEFMKYEYPKLISLSPSLAYKTIAMEYYRNWLRYLIEGGRKPQKPDIEVAYKSIDDEEFINNNYLKTNDNNVITIDFFNDCYNYNDKYNHSITNFINKKNGINPIINKDYYNTISKNNNNNYYRNRIKYDNEVINEKFNTNKTPNFISYYRNINKDYYNNKHFNTQNMINYSNTQNNFGFKKNIIKNNNINNNSMNTNKYLDKNKKDIIPVNNRIIDNQNIYNNNVLKAFKNNKKIYIKPKYNLLKSFEKNQISDQKQKDYIENNNKIKEIEISEVFEDIEDNDDKMIIRVNKGNIYEKFDTNKDNINKLYRDKIKINNDDINGGNNNIKEIERNYKISKVNSKSKLEKKKFSYFNLNRPINMETSEIKENKENKNEMEEKSNKDNIILPNNNLASSLNENIFNKNNIIFKKKNLKNSFCVNLDKKNAKNYTTENSQFEILSKNLNNITHDEIRSYEESNDDSLSINTIKTFNVNKSMRHFYNRYPRKMNKTKTKRSKLNDTKKKKEKREKEKIKQIRKEKSEIIQSLKILLKKKTELNTEKEEKNKLEENVDENKSEGNRFNTSIKRYDKKYKNFDNEFDEKKNNNLKKNIDNDDGLEEKKIIYKDNNTNNKNDFIDKGIIKEFEKEKEEKEYKMNKINDDKEGKKIHLNQSQELFGKIKDFSLEKDSIRNKYKKKQYRYSEMK